MQEVEGIFCVNDGTRKWPGNDHSGLEMGGNQGEDLRRNAIDVSKGVPPLADSRQRGCHTPVEPTNLVEDEAIE